MRRYYGLAKIMAGKVTFTETESKKFVTAKNHFEGQDVLLTLQPLSKIRSDEQHGLYRARNQQLSDATGHTTAYFHKLIFRACHIGAFADDQEPRTLKEAIRQFFNKSAADVTTEELNEAILMQDAVCELVNKWLPHSAHLVLHVGKNWVKHAGGRREARNGIDKPNSEET